MVPADTSTTTSGSTHHLRDSLRSPHHVPDANARPQPRTHRPTQAPNRYYVPRFPKCLFAGLALSVCVMFGCQREYIAIEGDSLEELESACGYLNRVGIRARVQDRKVLARRPFSNHQCCGRWPLPGIVLGTGLRLGDSWQELGKAQDEGALRQWEQRLVSAGLAHVRWKQTILVRPQEFLAAREAVGKAAVDKSYVFVYTESDPRPYEIRRSGSTALRWCRGEGVYVKSVDRLRAAGFSREAEQTLLLARFCRLRVYDGEDVLVTFPEEEAEEIVKLLTRLRIHSFRLQGAVYFRDAALKSVADSRLYLLGRVVLALVRPRLEDRHVE